MSATDITTFLRSQIDQYQGHQNTIKKVQSTLQHQHQTLTGQTIPKKHRPKPPIVIDNDLDKKLSKKFNSQYHKLFFETLQDAITQNTITLELEKARCQDIIRQTEKELSQMNEPPHVIQSHLNHFLKKLRIVNHQISPELHHKLQESPTPHSQTIPRSRHEPSTAINSDRSSNAATNYPSASKEKSKRTGPVLTTKRKRNIPQNTSQQPARKQLKIDHFLVKGPKLPPNPP